MITFLFFIDKILESNIVFPKTRKAALTVIEAIRTAFIVFILKSINYPNTFLAHSYPS